MLERSHVLCGVPVRQFSATIGLGGELQFCASAGRTPANNAYRPTTPYRPSRRLDGVRIYRSFVTETEEPGMSFSTHPRLASSSAVSSRSGSTAACRACSSQLLCESVWEILARNCAKPKVTNYFSIRSMVVVAGELCGVATTEARIFSTS